MVEHTAGMDLGVLRDDRDPVVRAHFADLLRRGDPRGGGSDDKMSHPTPPP
ncbi:hypothetical protein SDC9_144253 [bioreactor metagenome]|uniref:Uncharacterized protein n=1 Tax=bioreactor metagenome TaxID=1076179 RepID=A0A645E5L0_9ZZZZ